MTVLTRTYDWSQNSGGTGEGSSLKFAVKLPNFVTLSIASSSTVCGIPSKSQIPKNFPTFSKESEIESEIVVEEGWETVINWVELYFKFSSQLRNSKPLFGFAMHPVLEYR